MKIDATEHKTNGRKTMNDVLITSFRVGVIVSACGHGGGMTRLLMIALIAAAVCMAGAGVGAAWVRGWRGDGGCLGTQ